MKLYTVDVCIVGAGPAGALLGYLLANKGIKTIVIERHADLDREFRGEHLHGDVAKLLKKYGLFEKVKDKGILPMQRVDFYHGRRRVMSLSPELFGIEYLVIHFPHKHLLSVLVEEAAATGCFELLLKTAVTELLMADDRVIGLKAKQDGEEIEIRSSVVVGADGRHSTVRKLADIPTRIMKHGYDILWAKIPTPAHWEPTMRIVFVNGTQISLFATTGGFVQVGWQIGEGSFPELRKQSFQPFIDTLIQAAPDLQPFIEKHIRGWNDFICLPVQSCRCATWVKNGLALIGDAAHTMSPAGGIGVNLAMKDADVLAPVIAEAIRTGDCSAERLRTFEQSMRDEVERLQQGQVRQEAAMRKLNRSRWLKHLFWWNMRLLDKMPWKGKVFLKMYAAQK